MKQSNRGWPLLPGTWVWGDGFDRLLSSVNGGAPSTAKRIFFGVPQQVNLR
jgi:hypothetical protein